MLNRNIIIVVGTVVALCDLPPAIADESQPQSQASKMCPTTVSEAQQLQCWQDQYQLMKAENSALAEAKQVNSQTGENEVSDKARQITVPNVEMIYGTGKMHATLMYSDGRTLNVQVGEQVPGDFTVQTINANSVVLDHEGQPLVLLMGGNGSSLQSPPNDNSQPSSMTETPQPGAVVFPPGGIPGPAGQQGSN